MAVTYTPYNELLESIKGTPRGDLVSSFTRQRGYTTPETPVTVQPEPTVPDQPDTVQPEPVTPKQPVTVQQGGQQSPAPNLAPTQQPQAQQPAPSPFVSQPQFQISPFQAPNQFGSDFYQRLFQPVTQQGQQALGGLQQATQQFTQAAGPGRTFESIGGQRILQQALQPGRSEEEVQRGKSLVQSAYTGPQNLDRETIDRLTRSFADLRPQGRALTTRGGAQSFIHEAAPQLTPGQAQLEARLAHENPLFRQAASQTQREIEQLYGEFLKSQEQARDFAQARAGQESGIAEQARGFLTGERSEIDQALANRIAEERAAEQALRNLYGKFRETGELEDLEAIDPEAAAGFRTPGIEKAEEAERRFREVMEDPRFAALKDIPLMGLKSSSKGLERYAAEHYPEAIGRNLTPEEYNLSLQRQSALEDAGLDPRHLPKYGKSTPGEFSDVLPIHFAGDPLEALYKGPDPRSYVSLKTGTLATKDNLSTAEQKDRYNTIQQMLGEADRLADVDPYKSSELMAEVDRYLTDEEQALESRREALDSQTKDWWNRVKRARNEYRDKRLMNTLKQATGAALLAVPGIGQIYGGSMVSGSGDSSVRQQKPDTTGKEIFQE